MLDYKSSLYTILSVKPSVLSSIRTDTFPPLLPWEKAVYSCPWAKYCIVSRRKWIKQSKIIRILHLTLFSLLRGLIAGASIGFLCLKIRTYMFHTDEELETHPSKFSENHFKNDTNLLCRTIQLFRQSLTRAFTNGTTSWPTDLFTNF